MISKLEQIVSKAPKLELIVKDILYLEIGLKTKINALGLICKSLRNIKIDIHILEFYYLMKKIIMK